MQSSLSSTSALTASMNWLDRTANNIANQSTTGYAAQEGSFADTYTQALNQNATAPGVANRVTTPGWWGGSGVMATATMQNFAGMPVIPTGVPTDLAISGTGFFEVRQPNGSIALTKDGHFSFSPTQTGSMMLVNQNGNPVLDTAGKPIVTTSQNAQAMKVLPDGQIKYPTSLGPKIAIATVPVADATLNLAGNNLYTPAQGTTPAVVNGGAGTYNSVAGQMVQGSLVGSNVNLTAEMSTMIQAQEMYEVNAQAISDTDKMNQSAVGFKP